MFRRVVLVRIDGSEERSYFARLLVTANVVPNSQVLVTLMMKALHSSTATQRNVPKDGIPLIL
jgi:hypothetical protein